MRPVLYPARMTRTPRRDWYDEPHWYDILHAPGTRAEVAGLWRIARRFNPTAHPRVATDGRGPVWLEPACGSGRYLLAAARKGVRGVGIDLNPRMVAYARRGRTGGEPVAFHVGDMSDFRVAPRDRADLAFCLINSARHLLSDRAMVRHLRCVGDSLRPQGCYVLGMSLTCYATEIASEDVWVGTRSGTRVHQLVQYLAPYPKRRRERVISHLTITSRGGEQHMDSVYDLRTYDGPQWEGVLRRAGMACVGIVDEQGGDLPGTRSDGRSLLEPGRWFTNEATGYALFVLRPVAAVRAETAHLSGSSRVGGRSRR